MRKLRVNMCFNEADNSEVIRLIEQSGIKRPSGLIHDLVRKGILFEKLISGQVFNRLSVIQSEDRGKDAPPSNKHRTEPEPTNSLRQQEIPSLTPEMPTDIQSEGHANCLADLGLNFD